MKQMKEACWQAYQLCGAYKISEKTMDNFLAAFEGRKLPHKTWDWWPKRDALRKGKR